MEVTANFSKEFNSVAISNDAHVSMTILEKCFAIKNFNGFSLTNFSEGTVVSRFPPLLFKKDSKSFFPCFL